MDTRTPFNPFPGLRPFETSEAHLFFGREGQSVELLRTLRQHRFVAVVGPSGSGKSSLVRAGLLPSLHAGIMRTAGSRWRVAVLRPGANPIGNLAQALAEPDVLGEGRLSEADRREFMEITLRRGSLGLVEAVAEARLPGEENLLVVVDQFEEIFRFQRVSADTEFRDDATAFVKLLLEASQAEGVRCFVLLTMRSDYLGDCAQFRDLPEAINRGVYLIPRMRRDERRAAIVGPVAVGDGEIAPRLVSRILNDVGEDPDQLPILQHALMRAWEIWRSGPADGGPLDLSHYQAAGGAHEALSRHAEEAYAELGPAGQKLAARAFRRLTERGPDNRDIRRPTRFGELCAIVGAGANELAPVLDAFRRPGRSFLMPPADVPLHPGTLVDISHESLIRGWERLRGWVMDEADSARRFRRLADTAALWKAGRADLLAKLELSDVLDWWDRERPGAAWGNAYHPGYELAREFLERSREERDAEVHRARRREATRRTRRRAIVAALAAGLAITSATTVRSARALKSAEVAEEKARNAEKQARNAEKQARKAEGQARDAERNAEKRRVRAEAAERRARKALEGEAAALLAATTEAENARRAEGDARARAEALQRALQDAEAARQQLATTERRGDRSYLESQRYIRDLLAGAREDASVGSLAALLSRDALAASLLGRHDSAAVQLSNSLRLHPTSHFSLITRSDVYLNLGEPEKGIADLEFVLESDSRYYLAHLNMAVSNMLLGDHERAARQFRAAIDATQYDVDPAIQPEVSPEIQYATGRRSLELDRHETRAALRYALASTMALDPAASSSFVDSLGAADSQEDWSLNAILNPLNWLWLARRHRNWSEVADYGVYAAEGALWDRAGWTKGLKGEGRFRDAAALSYCRFRHLHAQRPNAYRGTLAGWVDSRLAEVAPFGCPATLDPPPLPGRVEDLMTSAALQVARDSLHLAEHLYSRALASATVERPYLFLDRGWVRYRLAERAKGRARTYLFTAAAADADSALALQPKLATAYFLRGRSRFMMMDRRDLGQVLPVLADLDTVLAYRPAMAPALFTRAWTLQWVDPREAAASARRAVALSPDEAELWAGIAVLEMWAGDLAGAQQAAGVAILLAPDSVRFYPIAEAARQGLPPDSLGSARVWLPVSRHFGERVSAYGVVGDDLRAERFAAAAFVALAEAAAAGGEVTADELLWAGRRYSCVMSANQARRDFRRQLNSPLAGIGYSKRAGALIRDIAAAIPAQPDQAECRALSASAPVAMRP